MQEIKVSAAQAETVFLPFPFLHWIFNEDFWSPSLSNFEAGELKYVMILDAISPLIFKLNISVPIVCLFSCGIYVICGKATISWGAPSTNPPHQALFSYSFFVHVDFGIGNQTLQTIDSPSNQDSCTFQVFSGDLSTIQVSAYNTEDIAMYFSEWIEIIEWYANYFCQLSLPVPGLKNSRSSTTLFTVVKTKFFESGFFCK